MEDKKNTEVKGENSQHQENRAEKKKTKEKPSAGRTAVLAVLGAATLMSGYFYYSLVARKNPPKVIYQKEEKAKEIVKEKVDIYLPDESGEGLTKKQVEIQPGATEEERIEGIFDMLKESLSYNIVYTDETGKVVEAPFLNEEVQLMDVFIDGKDLYLDMNYHFRENMKTISQEIFVIYSIVNTLTEDGRYRRVKFLINSKEVEQLNFYNLSDFYEKNLEI